jgi:hypothetical protein
MKLVHAIQILGNPSRIDMQVACPGCSARAMAYSDGSIMCIAEGGACYEPEPSDAGHPAYGELLRLRIEFDKANGISVTDRALLPTKVLGAPPQVASHGSHSDLNDGDRALFLNSAPSPDENERIGGNLEGLKPWDQLI